jgi:hypothetical protein
VVFNGGDLEMGRFARGDGLLSGDLHCLCVCCNPIFSGRCVVPGQVIFTRNSYLGPDLQNPMAFLLFKLRSLM